MSTIITSLLIIAFIIAIVFVFKWVDRIHVKKTNDKMISRLSHAGTKHGLSFTSQELLRDKVIGVDGIHRTFVVVNEKEECTIINLEEVKNCRFQKSYEQIQYGEGANRRVENRLSAIGLLFEYEKRNKMVPVHFFNYTIHSISEANALEAKAKDWETILSKMISAREAVRA